MNEFLGVITAFGVMMGGERLISGPIPCDKQITSSVESYVLRDEGGKLGENIRSERRQVNPHTFDILYKIRRYDGSEGQHLYRVSSSGDCKDINVHRRTVNNP